MNGYLAWLASKAKMDHFHCFSMSGWHFGQTLFEGYSQRSGEKKKKTQTEKKFYSTVLTPSNTMCVVPILGELFKVQA